MTARILTPKYTQTWVQELKQSAENVGLKLLRRVSASFHTMTGWALCLTAETTTDTMCSHLAASAISLGSCKAWIRKLPFDDSEEGKALLWMTASDSDCCTRTYWRGLWFYHPVPDLWPGDTRRERRIHNPSSHPPPPSTPSHKAELARQESGCLL